MEQRTAAVSVRNVTKRFGPVLANDKVCLDIYRGEILALLGENGSGKTTLMNMLSGIYYPDEGEIYLGDEAINALTPNKRDTAMVFQSYALLPHYNVFDNVAYGLKLRKVPKDEIKERVMKILDLVELTGMEGRMTNQLSGGQQQRVALARALVIEPSVLLFDEPLSNLDAKLRVSMRTEIRRIQQEVGITAIYVTHDQSEAMALSDNIIIMKNGVVEQMGSPQEIYYHPVNEFVADFIGTTNILSVKGLGENTVSYGNDRIPTTKSVNAGQEYCLSIRPECLKLVKEAVDGQVNVKVTIQNKMFLGEKIRYFVNDSLGKEWIIDIYDPGRTILEGEAYAAFPFEKAWLIEDLTD